VGERGKEVALRLLDLLGAPSASLASTGEAQLSQ